MVSHPDRGGTQDEFHQVSIALRYYKKIKSNSEVQLDHNQLKESRTGSILQDSQQLKNINMREDFDINVNNISGK